MKFDKLIEKQLDALKGGLADGKTPEDIAELHDVDIKIIYKQLEKGIDVEYEHTDDRDIAADIALDHLVENPYYYDYLEKMEKDMKIKNESMTSTSGVFGTADSIGQMGGKPQSDFYATGDARIPHSIFGGKVMTRHGSTSKKKNSKKTKTKKHSSNS